MSVVGEFFVCIDTYEFVLLFSFSLKTLLLKQILKSIYCYNKLKNGSITENDGFVVHRVDCRAVVQLVVPSVGGGCGDLVIGDPVPSTILELRSE